MTAYGWIHIIRSKEHADQFWKAIINSEKIAIFHYAILNGALITKDGRLFGVEDEPSFVFMTNSGGTQVIDEFIEKGLTSHEETVCLDDLDEDDFIETDQDGLIIWSATYLSGEGFYLKIDSLE
ncbi:MAG: hypothetical protein E3J73_04815 [Candidatus Bathyarchaeum sp.]|nr:MAG: hypothetical protein E3J73_04815 [Candidatus Bathyarchaeum sp.]